jgi:phosphoserine aminotransferase
MNNPIYFTAGPSQLHAQYNAFHQQAMDLHLGSLNHRSEGFRKIYQETDAQLRELMQIPNEHEIYFSGSASEIWERMILNLVDKHSCHFVNGSFSKRFYEYSLDLGKNATSITAAHGIGFDLENTQILNNTELICTTQNETSAGVFMPDSFYTELNTKKNNALICADLVSIAPIAAVDYSIVDSSFFSVQKAFGMPPGLGVWIANEKCLQKAYLLKQQNKNIGAHHSLITFANNYKKWETPSTPNVVAIYILGKIAASYNANKQLWQNAIEIKKNMIDTFVESTTLLSHLVVEKSIQSSSVMVLKTALPSKQIIEQLALQGLHISSGYGATKDSEIRISNFPTTSIADMERLVTAMRKL